MLPQWSDDLRHGRWHRVAQSLSIIDVSRVLAFVPMLIGPPMVAIGLAIYAMNGRRVSPHEESSLKWSLMIAALNICLSLMIWYRLGSELAEFARSLFGQIGLIDLPESSGRGAFKI